MEIKKEGERREEKKFYSKKCTDKGGGKMEIIEKIFGAIEAKKNIEEVRKIGRREKIKGEKF